MTAAAALSSDAPAPGVRGPSARRTRRGRAPGLGVEVLEGRVVCSGLARGLAPPPAAVAVAAERLRPAAAGPTRLADLPYTAPGQPSERLDLYRPAGTPPPGGWPVVLAIHGGGWRRFSKEQYAAKVAPTLLAHGYAVVAPNYTLSSPRAAGWPVVFEELQQAVRWVRATAPGLGLDPSRVAAMGESAGGHLALMLGTDPSGPDTRVSAVIDFFGPTDLAALRAQSPVAAVAVNQLLGPSANDPSALADASPVSHVAPGDPPVMVLQGTADPLVPFAQSSELATALTAARVPNALVLIPGAGHGFGFRGAGRSVLPAVLGFLDRSLSAGP